MRVLLVGSSTLDRFTDGILRSGLKSHGCEVVSDSLVSQFAIIQIHGAPSARTADLEIIEQIPEIASRCDSSIILLHRPDEIKDSIPQLKPVLAKLPATVGLVMLGDLFIDDPFYVFPHLLRRAVPHGFFNIEKELPASIVIGSHTTWGEMRSIERTLKLLSEIALQTSQSVVIAYLGGLPVEELSLEAVSANLSSLDIPVAFNLEQLQSENWQDQLNSVTKNTIFLCPGSAPHNMDVTFNVQLYHYGPRVRLGESSGSLHASVGIPVIFEMNGSEKIEELKTIKIPYLSPDNVNSADLKSAARSILNVIDTGEYRHMISHNRAIASRWNDEGVARLYIEFLESLKMNG